MTPCFVTEPIGQVNEDGSVSRPTPGDVVEPKLRGSGGIVYQGGHGARRIRRRVALAVYAASASPHGAIAGCVHELRHGDIVRIDLGRVVEELDPRRGPGLREYVVTGAVMGWRAVASQASDRLLVFS